MRTTGFASRLENYRVSVLPVGVCGWCRHPRGLHREGGECVGVERGGRGQCRCLRAQDVVQDRRV